MSRGRLQNGSKVAKQSRKARGGGKLKELQAENYEIEQLIRKCGKTIDTSTIKSFKDFPLSKKTLEGLKENKFEKPTEIQRESILFGLRGIDILGAAKTGSGKTLAFIIPVLEVLYKNRWSNEDGLGAVIITPVRELAYQIFDVLKKVGKAHDFSASLIFGGRDATYEKDRIGSTNIMICTPGRVLQHLDESANLDVHTVKILVLDEADKILEMGFADEVNAIVDHLPKTRQTLLFSATQTKSVKDLARLSLKRPVFVSVHEHAKHCTPESLKQSYIVCKLEDKLSLLWSFLKHHSSKKILVFVTTCKQVAFIANLFYRLSPGADVIGLNGNMQQHTRMTIYDKFWFNEKGILIATNIASRGLDFPSVDWVVQMDCPTDVNDYIHRAGRTARYNKGGESLLFLMPSEEEAMVAQLGTKKIPLTKIIVNPSMNFNMEHRFAALLSYDVKLNSMAKSAFVTYLKSVYLMRDKKVFNVTKLNTEAYSRSFGLRCIPRVRFLENRGVIITHHKMGDVAQNTEQDDEQDQAGEKPENSTEPCPLRMSTGGSKEADKKEPSQTDDDDFLQVKRQIRPEKDDLQNKHAKPVRLSKKKLRPVSRMHEAEKILKKKLQVNTKLRFDEHGKVIKDVVKHQLSVAARLVTDEDEGGLNIKAAQQIMAQEDIIDRKLQTMKIKELRKARMEEKRKLVKDRSQSHRAPKAQVSLSDDEHSVDLSFLPDPDKVYGKSGSSDDDDARMKRKQRIESSSDDERPQFKRIKDYNFDTAYSFTTEELALKLLSVD